MTPHKRDVVLIRAGTPFWQPLTPSEVQMLHDADRRAGRFMDDAGESIIHDHMTSDVIRDNTVATVLRTRGLKWTSWYRRPPHLVEVLMAREAPSLGIRRVFVQSTACKVLKHESPK